MSGESSRRSDLIDVTYDQLHSYLIGREEGVPLDEISSYLRPRKEQLKNLTHPFGNPSDASRKTIESGSVTLADGVTLRIEDVDKDYIYAVSDRFKIDEIQAFILLRSFLYNRGLPSDAEATSTEALVAELLEAIVPFYYSERISVLHVFAPLLRAKGDEDHWLHAIATDFLLSIFPDTEKLADVILDGYMQKLSEQLPKAINSDPKLASRWAKQHAREQLAFLEVLFWSMWSFSPCNGRLVVKILETAYETNLGLIQQNSTLLLDSEGQQLQQDCATIWVLITVEILELESLASLNSIEISDKPARSNFYISSPQSLKRIHELVTSHLQTQHSCVYLGWAYVLSRLSAKAAEMKEIPESYRPFFETVLPHLNRPYSKDREPAYVLMTHAVLEPEVGFFNLLQGLLISSPVFVPSIAWRLNASVLEPNPVAFRAVIKGLLIGLVELMPLEMIPDYDAFLDVWITLFGRSDSAAVQDIAAQYWESDRFTGIARSAIVDVPRTRFPIHFRPLVRLLRAMTASGFLGTDPLSTADHSYEGQVLPGPREFCDTQVFGYMQRLSTYSQLVPLAACTGPHALYEKQERYGPTISNGLTYVNLRPIKLPGGSTLPARSVGRLLSGDGGDYIVVLWQHEHSGWKLILELLTSYVNRRLLQSGSSNYSEISFAKRTSSQMTTLRLEDIGVEVGKEEEECLVTDALDLIRSVIQDNPETAEALVRAMDSGDPVVSHIMTETQPPDLVQLTIMILEDALSQSTARPRIQPKTGLITSAMSVLSALLALPSRSPRIWLYVRSTAALFGSDKTNGLFSSALAAERATGHYTMTLALLHLVQSLFHEASTTILPDKAHLYRFKEDVLLRATRFVHTEIWVEHLGWKYAQLGDRFEIGRRISTLYGAILQHSPPTLQDRPFAALSQSVMDALLFKATSSTINPLLSAINSGNMLLQSIQASGRTTDANRLTAVLQSHLRLTRIILNLKRQTPNAARPCLLEQALCARVTAGASSHASFVSKVDPIDALALYVKKKNAGSVVPLESILVLHALCVCLSSSQSSPLTIIGHLSDPEATVASFVGIVQHPYEELSLRNAVWNFITLAVDKEPALASLFVTGKFRTPADVKGKAAEKQDRSKPSSAVGVACGIISSWKALWDPNPQLLASVMRFLDMVWQHGLEHKAALEDLHSDDEFWQHVVSMANEEIGPTPDYDLTSYMAVDNTQPSNVPPIVASHCYRTVVKSFAVHMIGVDIGIHLQLHGKEQSAKKPKSFLTLEPKFRSQEHLTDLICEAAPSSYDPQLHDRLVEHWKQYFKGLTLEQLRLQDPLDLREFGDNFVFSMSLFRTRLSAYKPDKAVLDYADIAEKQILSVNLNLSLAHSQTTLMESWRFLLQQVAPYLRSDTIVRPIILSIAGTISYDISKEARSGDMMAAVHGTRLGMLLALLEVAWFSISDKAPEIQSFMELVRNVHGIIMSDTQPPIQSLMGSVSSPFHRPLLQIIYFCARHCGSLSRRPKVLNADQRLTISSTVEASLNFVIDGLGLVFTTARTRQDQEVDKDMELLVAVFEQCIHRDVNPSSTLWLARCQETDIIKQSLDLFTHIDLVGLSDLPLLLSMKRPLYVAHIFLFHIALVRNPSAAERLASDGVMSAYSNNFISAAISAGLIDVVLPEFPGERSPAHKAYCSMLAIVAGVITALGRHNHYFDAEASAFVQLYGDQISRALSWTIGDPMTFPFLEEMEQVVNLFYAIAESTPAAASVNPAVEKVLRVFTTHSLHLLQQVNYAITHPNHLASLLEPITSDERARLEKEPTSADPLQRPTIAYLIHHLYRLSSNIISTLISISRAEAVLLDQRENWPVNEALVVPHSKVVLDEPASMGTLLELGNCTLDVLRDLVNRPPGQSLILLPANNQFTLDVRQGVATARRNLEAVLVYAVTQLVMWLSKPEFDGLPMESDAEEPPSMEISRTEPSKDRRNARPSVSLAERLRRGMTGEMAADLHSLLSKSKPAIAKSNEISGRSSVDLTQVLSNFLQERIAAAPA